MWVRKFHILLVKTDTHLFYLIVVPLSASGSHWGQQQKSNSLSRWARLFQFFLVVSTAFSVLLIVNLKISLQWLKTGMWEMCTAVSGAAWNTVVDIWLYLKMELLCLRATVLSPLRESGDSQESGHSFRLASTSPQDAGRTSLYRGNYLSKGWWQNIAENQDIYQTSHVDCSLLLWSVPDSVSFTQARNSLEEDCTTISIKNRMISKRLCCIVIFNKTINPQRNSGHSINGNN